MVKPFKLAAVAATAAMLIAGATPAMARPGPWGGYGGGYGYGPGYGGGWGHGGRGWRRGGGGVSFGDVLLGAVIVGGVAAVANGVANGRTQDRRDDGRYDDGRYDDGYGRGRIDGAYEGAGYRDDRAEGGPQADAAADRCADAARIEAGSGSRIDGIRHVGRDGVGWRVEGDVTEARGYGQSFVCGVRADRVDFVQLSDRIAVR